MDDLEALIRDVVREQMGVGCVVVEPLRGALGLRRFARVWLEAGTPKSDPTPKTVIARVEAPEDAEGRPADAAPEPPLEPIRALLESEGLPVPKSFGADPSRGVELLQDLGDRALVDLASSLSASELEPLYTEACSLIPRLQRIAPQPGVAAFERRLDQSLFRYKAARFARFSFSRQASDGGANATETKLIKDTFAMIAEEIQTAPFRLAHRDFQSANLHLEQTQSAAKPRLVMIDLQGAFMAAPEYDLVCLLRDSYIELDDPAVTAQLERVRPLLPDAPEEEIFRQRFDLLTLTRKAKDHALFCYAAAERGDSRYLRYLPTTKRYLEAAAVRVAAKDSRFRDFADLVTSMPVAASSAEHTTASTTEPALTSSEEPPCVP